MSGHTAAAAAVLVICAQTFDGWPLVAAPVVALIGWARVRLKDHTVAQVVAGTAFGATIALVGMPPLAGW
jgi:membrane-associated phospholipid phosphatase